jgi:hypothetical protein
MPRDDLLFAVSLIWCAVLAGAFVFMIIVI